MPEYYPGRYSWISYERNTTEITITIQSDRTRSMELPLSAIFLQSRKQVKTPRVHLVSLTICFKSSVIALASLEGQRSQLEMPSLTRRAPRREPTGSHPDREHLGPRVRCRWCWEWLHL